MAPVARAPLIAFCLGGILAAGCLGSGDRRLVSTHLGDPLPYELAGANVSFEGEVELVLATEVPGNASILYFSWWAADGTSGRNNGTTVVAPGCPQLDLGQAVGSVDWVRWCQSPAPGTKDITYNGRGSLTGRICVVNLPVGADEIAAAMQCQSFPYWHMCAAPPRPSFCAGRP